MSIFRRLFGQKESSSAQAKNRLKLVLVHDRVDLSPGKMELLKDELIKVISKYVEIDSDGIDISLSRNNEQSQLVANIPLLEVRHK
ncbi:MAG: cell division topological specificity factor MinE [Chloroflexi bacterium]|nr:MAG: cell division topological specificity factor MinE [Chloroflexota bacterium]